MTRSLAVHLVCALAASALTLPADAQDSVAAAVNRAQQLQQAGSWEDGRALLTRTLADCSQGEEGRGCRGVVLSALGYLHQRQAQDETPDEADLLTRAADYYRQAILQSPHDGASLMNLALTYQALGRDTDLQQLLEAALEQDPDHAAFYALLLGDVYGDQSRWDRAVQVYGRGIAAAPDNEALRRRLVDAYRQLPPDSAARLFRLVSESPDWEARFPDASARAYEVVVSMLAGPNREIAARACMRWIGVLSDAQLLSAARLDAVGDSWLTAPLAELKTFLQEPKRPPVGSFWRDPAGREALGRAALELGLRRSAAADAVGAEMYWQMGLRIAEAFPEAPVMLDLAMETAALYQRHRELDPDGGKFRDIEQRLFDQKSEAYARADKDAIQQLHTVLGLIYVERGIWRSNLPWTNATYQLEHALSTARERDAASGSYQPLPQLRARLAQTYEALGRTSEATATYLTAAEAYLDADDPRSAQRMLERGSAVAGPQPEQTARALDALIRARAAGGPAGDARPSLDACERGAQHATGAARAAGLDAAFLKRQQFKLLADCVVGGNAAVRPADAARVFNLVATEKIPLVGVGDLVRLQRSQNAVNRLLRVSNESPNRKPDVAAPRREGMVRVQLSTELRPRYIPINTDALVGTRVIEHLASDSMVRAVSVRDGKVTVVTNEASDTTKQRLQTKVQTVQGVQSTKVRVGSNVMQRAPAPGPAPVPPPAAEDVAGALNAVVAAYARALESRSLDAVRKVVPEFDAQRLEGLFARAQGLTARIAIEGFSVDGDRANARITGVLEYRELGLPKRQRFEQRAVFGRGPNGEWRMTSVR